jgi:hypothetical protein
MNGAAKGMLMTLMIIYILSPVDACPGPIDDLLVLIIGIAASKETRENEE